MAFFEDCRIKHVCSEAIKNCQSCAMYSREKSQEVCEPCERCGNEKCDCSVYVGGKLQPPPVAFTREVRDSLLAEIENILCGIDKDNTDDPLGWWETSQGTAFGREKLEKVRNLLSESEGVGSPTSPLCGFCRDCKWWGDGERHTENGHLRTCINEEKLDMGYSGTPATAGKDGVLIERDEGWGMFSAPYFGCVHFKAAT
jgi:hypothetical protein